MHHDKTVSHGRLHSSTVAVSQLFLLFLAVFAFNSPTFAEGPRSVAPLAKRLSGAVVNISTAQKLKGPSGVPLPNVPDGSPFEDLFKDFFNKKGQPKRRSRKVSSLGSGFVIDGEKGLIVTNNHVIDGADEITVNFKDGNKLRVDKVLGRDPKTDLALLKVTPKSPLPSVKFGSSDKLEVGDWVLAIGNPFGLGGSVSIGIISAKQRDIQSGPYDNYLQTDAAINKGNSGGPLFNMDGDVIGVNTAIISPTGGSIGIGFAVPADIALPIIDQLMKYGETRRGWLGVNIQSITDDLAASLGVSDKKGALVSSVRKGSPADKGGLKAGDVILKFDDKVVANMRALPRIVARTAHGKEVNVDIIRKGNRESLTIVVGRLEEGDPKKKKAKEKKESKAKEKEPSNKLVLGMSLSVLDDQLRKKYKLGAKKLGLVVTEVKTGSPAATKLLVAGQVIVAADQKPMFKLSDLVNAIASVKERGRPSILLRVEDSSGNLRFVALPVT
ncbi:MAG: Do family serine endopeptidase [Pseudomonadota bacterium]